MKWIPVVVMLVGCSPDVNSDRCGSDGCPLGQRCEEDFCVPAGDAAAVPRDGAADGGFADGGAVDAARVADGGVADAAPPIRDAGAVADAAAMADAAPMADGAPPLATCDGMHPPALDGDGRPCPDDATLALWRFDHDTAAVAGPGRPAPNAARSVVAVRLDPSPRGGAARFAGTPDQSFEMVGPLRVRLPLSIELWVNPDATGNDERALVSNARVVPVAGTWTGGWEVALVRTEAHLYTPVLRWAAPEGLFADGRAELPSDAPPIRTGEWSSIVVSIPADGPPALVVNGYATVGVDPAQLADEANAADLSLGGRTGDDAVSFSGLLDEVRISAVAR